MAKTKTRCGRKVPKPTDADSTEPYIEQRQAIVAGEQAWKDNPTSYELVERRKRIRREGKYSPCPIRDRAKHEQAC